MSLLAQPEQEQQQQPRLASPLIQPQSPMPSQDFFWYRLDPSDIIDEVEHKLKGEVFVKDAQGRGSWQQKFDQELGDDIINDILKMIYSFGVNKNTILGCLKHEEIYQRCYSIWIELSKFFFINSLRGKINVNRSKRSIIIKEIVYLIHSGLSRSEMGRESGQLSTASQRIEHLLKEDKQKQNAINPLNWLPGRKGG